MVGVKQRQHLRSFKDLKREINARSEPPTTEKKPEQAGVSTAEAEDCWAPSSYTAWKLLLSARLCAALWSGVADCDETFNYWEPTHHLLYGQGMQTWEYDPRYALRSYMYLMVHSVPAWLYAKLLQPNPMLVFYFLRCLLGCVSASCEVYFYRGVVQEFGVNIGRLTLAFLTLSTGMFVASTAYLPSSTSLYLTLLAYGAWFRGEHRLAIFATALSAILSWPFTALLGVPLAVDLVLVRGRVHLFLSWALFSGLACLGPILLCDTFYYGKPVLAALNIVMYNVFSGHGPDLYGTEPASFYLLNGLLNFNLVFPAALAVLPLRGLANLVFGHRTFPLQGRSLSLVLSQLGLYLWLVVFWPQPHKEERFLFPVYPLIVLAGAVTVDTVQRGLHALLHSRHQQGDYLNHTGWVAASTILVFGVISMSRITALYQHYQGSTEIWMKVAQLEPSQHTTQVCVGKEWHRFPSSFFLPDTSFRLGFLQSEFRGQLPKYYSTAPPGILPTTLIHEDFNNGNLEEPSRYVPHPGKCHYIVDLDNDEVSARQPRYHGHANWTEVAEQQFLDAAASHPFFRAFYVPGLDSRFCKYNKYLLLARTKE